MFWCSSKFNNLLSLSWIVNFWVLTSNLNLLSNLWCCSCCVRFSDIVFGCFPYTRTLSTTLRNLISRKQKVEHDKMDGSRCLFDFNFNKNHEKNLRLRRRALYWTFCWKLSQHFHFYYFLVCPTKVYLLDHLFSIISPSRLLSF